MAVSVPVGVVVAAFVVSGCAELFSNARGPCTLQVARLQANPQGAQETVRLTPPYRVRAGQRASMSFSGTGWKRPRFWITDPAGHSNGANTWLTAEGFAPPVGLMVDFDIVGTWRFSVRDDIVDCFREVTVDVAGGGGGA